MKKILVVLVFLLGLGAFGVMAQIAGPEISTSCRPIISIDGGLPSEYSEGEGMGDRFYYSNLWTPSNPITIVSDFQFVAYTGIGTLDTLPVTWQTWSSEQVPSTLMYFTTISILDNQYIAIDWFCLDDTVSAPQDVYVSPTPQGEGSTAVVTDCTTGDVPVVDQLQVNVPVGCAFSGDFTHISGNTTVPSLDSIASTGRFFINNTQSVIQLTMWSNGTDISDGNLSPVSNSRANIASMLTNLPNCAPSSTCRGVEVFSLDLTGINVQWITE